MKYNKYDRFTLTLMYFSRRKKDAKVRLQVGINTGVEADNNIH